MRMCCCTGSNAAPFVVILGGAMVAAMSAGLHAGAPTSGNQPEAPGKAALPAPATDPAYVLDHEAALIDGTVQDLNAFEGRVVLIVNTASRCGLTPQYEALEKLYRAHKKDGLVILGFPANDFGNQEPGSNEQIREFCSSRFEVSFPMFEKISVVGDDAHPLFKQLRGFPLEAVGGKQGTLGGDPTWNFTKFLVDRAGRIDSRYAPRVTPDDPRLTERIKELLASEG